MPELPSTDLPIVDDLRQLLIAGVPMIDTRAPVEFTSGSFPTAVNLPLMSDAERQEIGRTYKQAGQDAAIELGFKRVSGQIRDDRIAAWKAFAEQHPEGVLFCFRGGLRSRISQQWLSEHSGIQFPRVQGGYKALRRYLLEQLEVLPEEYAAIVLSGRTGSGKTRFLKTFQQTIDLEGLANHRGSAFGPQVTPQPTQIDFEHTLAISLLQQLDKGFTQLLFEDESQNIGSVHLPKSLAKQLSTLI